MTEETGTTVETPQQTEGSQENPAQEAATDSAQEETQTKLNQTVHQEDIGPCKKRIKVAVSRGDIDRLLSDKYKELVSDSYVPGFRPGKAPRQVVVRKFQKEVHDQVKGQLLLASLEQLADDFDVAPLSPPNLNPEKIFIPEKGDFVYEFEVEVRPQFDLPEYKGVRLKRPVRTFSDKDVDEEQNRILSRFGQLVPIEGGSANLGDYVVCDMVCRMDGKEIGTNKEITLRVDDTVTFKDGVARDFGKKMAGAKAGDQRSFDIVLTGAVGNPNWAGQAVEARVEVKDIKSLRLPELDEAFLEQFDVKTPEQFREKILVVLQRRLEYAQRQSARQQILERIAESANWDLPNDMLMRQARRAFQRRVLEMRESGMLDEEIKNRQRLLEQDVLNSTRLALKEHFVLQKIAEVEKIEIDEDDIDLEVERIADQMGESPRKVRAQMEREDLLETLAAQLIERKALDLILDSAEYEDVEQGKEDSVSSVEAQAVAGELKDPTAAPPAEEKPEGEPPAS